MTQNEVIEFVRSELDGTVVFVASEENGAPKIAWGDVFFFYDPDDEIPPEKRFPYATIVINDYPGFDEQSNLVRPDVFRVNAWVSRDSYQRELATVDESSVDYTILDEIIPHPVYGKQGWLSVLNPGPATEDKLKDLLAEAHARARTRHEKRHPST